MSGSTQKIFRKHSQIFTPEVFFGTQLVMNLNKCNIILYIVKVLLIFVIFARVYLGICVVCAFTYEC